MNKIILVLLFSVTAPLPLLVIEQFLPYPFVLEETFKLIAVVVLLTIPHQNKRNLLPVAVLCGLLFAVSESIFYLLNLLPLQMYNLFWQRLLITGILHSLTIGIIFICGKRGTLWLLGGFILAILIHYFYNLIV